MIITNKFRLPKAIVNAVSPEQHNEQGCISATTLLKGTKEIILSNRHWNEMSVDVSDMIYAIFGTATHALLEDNESDDVLKEVQFSKKFMGVTVTGRVDNYDPKEKVLNDYKTASVWKVKLKSFEDWRKQGLVYAYLMRESGYEVKHVRFIAMLKDWSRREARFGRKEGYPENNIYIYEFDIDDKDFIEIEKFIQDKVSDYILFKDMEDDEIPPCSAHERWERGECWAVMKDGAKKASKLFKKEEGKTEEDAKKYCESQKEKYKIEHRDGESGKCLDYCQCCDFCNFYKKISKEFSS